VSITSTTSPPDPSLPFIALTSKERDSADGRVFPVERRQAPEARARAERLGRTSYFFEVEGRDDGAGVGLPADAVGATVGGGSGDSGA
jgi:hypothetical protein